VFRLAIVAQFDHPPMISGTGAEVIAFPVEVAAAGA
jgi:hypothetical protein